MRVLSGGRLALCAAAAIALLTVAFAFRGPLTRRALELAVGAASGQYVQIANARLGARHASLDGVTLSAADGTPVAVCRRIELSYALRDLFGSPHPFGISGIALDGPRLSLIHYRDGSWNVRLPSGGGGSAGTLPALRLRVRDGSLTLLDETRLYPHSRRLGLDGLAFEGNFDSAARSGYRAAFTLVEPGGRFPVAGRATFDPPRGYQMQRWRAARLAIGPLVDYALNSPTLHVAAGELGNLDAVLYGLRASRGSFPGHVAATTELRGLRLYLDGLSAPLRDGAGLLRAYDDGLAIPRITGTVAGVPVTVAGAIYDFAEPALRLGITGRGDLRRLASLSANAGKVAVGGTLGFGLLVEGPSTQPLTLANLSAPRALLNGYVLDGIDAQVALAGSDLDVLRSALRYGPVAVAARGQVGLDRTRQSRLVTAVDASAASLPFLAYAVPGMRLNALAVLSGSGTTLAANGVVDGAGPAERLSGSFAIAGDGSGTVGPLELAGPGPQRLFAQVALEGQRATAAWVQARGLQVGTRPLPALPGLRLPELPDAAGELDADMAGILERRRYALAGSGRVAAARLRGIPLGELRLRGFARDGSRLAVTGRYRGDLAPLGALAGGKFALRGGADIPLAVIEDGPTRLLAQIDGARFEGAEVAGVGIEDLALTAGVSPRRWDVYAARARLEGHDVLAQGRIGEGGRLEVSTRGLDLAALRGLGLPLEQGRLSAVADIGGNLQEPELSGGFIAEGRLRGVPVSASSTLDLASDRLTLGDGLMQAGTAVGTVAGDVDGIRSRPARASYAVRASVRDADIASLANVLQEPLPYPAGTLNADLEVAGSGSQPLLRGDMTVPEGSLNGLAFRDGALALDGTPSALSLRDGRVIVGTSLLAFDGSLAAADRSLSLRSPRIDLADFNDYFDRGDTLGGRGRLELRARSAPNALVLWARGSIAGAQFRHFNLGTAQADVSTQGRTVRVSAALGGAIGRLGLHGSVRLPPTDPLRDPGRRSELALVADASQVDLQTWLPVAGLRQPVAGHLNGEATVRGRYPAVALALRATVEDGRFGRVPIDHLSVQASAQNGHVTVGSAALAVAGLAVAGSGTFGLRPSDPVALTLQADASDLAQLYRTATGKPAPDGIGGAARASARLGGTPRLPQLHGDVGLEGLRYRGYTLPHARAILDAKPALVSLVAAEFDLAQGRITANGRAPFELRPRPGIGPPGAPLSLELNADHVDLAQFAPLLPRGTALGGLLAGRLGLLGTLAQPQLNGTLALVDVSFVSPQERAKLTGGTAQLTFAGTSASLHDAHVDVGGGTIAVLASAAVPSLRAPGRDLTFDIGATSRRAGLDLPAYFRGAVDGQVSLAKAPGSRASLAGDLTLDDARIPLSAVLGAPGPSPAATPNLPDVGLNLRVSARRDVRVQSGQVDIGAQGSVRVGGSLQSPTLAGRFTATDGTLDFYRSFVLGPDSSVSFSPALGLVPRVNAYATTSIPDPPTQVELHVTGPATQLNVALQSDPPYTREQIVGLLAGLQNLGAVQGVATTQGQQNNQNFLGSVAEGQLSSMFTRNLLEPLGAQIGSAIGLNSLSLGYNPSSGLGLGARKALFKDLDVIYAESFNYPQRTTVGLRASPNRATAVQLTFFNQQGTGQFLNAPTTLVAGDPAVTASQPANGTSGFSFSLQRKFR